MFAFKIFYLAKNAERGKKCQIWLHFPFWPILEFFQRGKKRVIRQKIPKIWPKWLKMVLASNCNGFVPLHGAQHNVIGFLAGSYNGIRFGYKSSKKSSKKEGSKHSFSQRLFVPIINCPKIMNFFLAIFIPFSSLHNQ